MEKLFRENKKSPLLKTPEKDFHISSKKMVLVGLPGVAHLQAQFSLEKFVLCRMQYFVYKPKRH